MENYSGSDMAWYRGGRMAAAVVIQVVLWSEFVSLALGSGLCQVFGGIEGALIHQGGHRQFLPCMRVAFYPDSIGFTPTPFKVFNGCDRYTEVRYSAGNGYLLQVAHLSVIEHS